ncbi:hypothetical protein BC829DRAFT_404068 [Chytridium lagenaria]|nr:hypothetical protein BC829DRAFT_404068 [Chytridium lagenaria]
MISAMTLADLAALQRRLHPADSPALASYLIHCHGAIKLIKRYLASVTVFWHVSEDYLDGAAELLDGPFERAPSVATRAFRKSIVKGERFASYMEKGLEKAREEPRSPYWKDRIGSIRPEEVVGGGAGEAEFLASLGLDGDGNLGVGSSPTRTPDLDALIREVLG